MKNFVSENSTKFILLDNQNNEIIKHPIKLNKIMYYLNR